MARHKHADLIHAWADGAEIQVKQTDTGGWLPTHNPGWYDCNEYRIKPRIVKREGWVNVYTGTQSYTTGHFVYDSKDKARNESMGECVATVKIEWEESE